MKLRRYLALLAGVGLFAGLQVPASAHPAAGPQTFVIGVDHLDPANQQLDNNGNPTTPPGVQARVFEYTDFFGRSVKVHQGDTLDFRFAIPDHMISVAPNEAAARLNGPLFTPPFPGAPSLPLFPLFKPDETSGGEGNAIGSGGPKIELGLAVIAGFAFPPTCGLAPSGPCQFDGSPSDAGWIPPGAGSTDWSVTINAAPGGTFTYFCHFHPGMRGKVTVVPNNVRIQTQAQIDKESAKQFRSARAQAMRLYNEANQVQAEQKDDGPTVYTVHVGVTSKDRHIAIHDMLPASLNLAPGDVVKYKWETNVIHTVGFTNVGPALLGPFGLDCYPANPSYVDIPMNPPGPCGEQEGSAFNAIGFGEVIGDPGTTAPGSPLTTAGGADSGLLAGADYAQYYGPLGASTWSITASDSGTFKYKCLVHDWMSGTLTVSS